MPGFGILEVSNHLIAYVFINFGAVRKGLIVMRLTLTVVTLTKRSDKVVREMMDCEFPHLHIHVWSS